MNAPLGLLLDVDGPLASTVTRTVRVPTIAADLAAFAAAGCPVVFNTGRSHDFLIERVLPELAAHGVTPDSPVWGVGEKGGTWFSLDRTATDVTASVIEEDPALVPPRALVEELRELAARHEDVAFWDETKRTMISIEQRIDVDNDAYLARQPEFVDECAEIVGRHGTGFHIVPSVISVDVEHVHAGKALGAQRGLALVAASQPAPARWFTAGDSLGDYDMAQWLHAHGYDVTHLDIRRDAPERPADFPVVRERPTTGRAEDDITAEHLTALRRELGI